MRPDPGPREHVEHLGSRVPVVVAVTHRHDRFDGDRSEELGLARRPAVVGDLEEPAPQRGRALEQVALRSPLDVAGQQRGTAGVAGAHDDRGLVLLGVGTDVRTPRRRGEHLERQRPDGRAVTRDRDHHRDAGQLGSPDRVVRARELRRQGRGPHRADSSLPEHGRGAVDVVGVRVREHEQVEVAAATRTQPTRRTPVATGVEQHTRVRCLDQHRVALPDVYRGDDEAAQRGRQDDAHERHDHGGGEQRGQPTGRSQQPQRDDHRRDEPQRPSDVERPTAPAEALGDGEHDRQRGAREPEHGGTELRVDERGHRRRC